jgi:hypothetical protein
MAEQKRLRDHFTVEGIAALGGIVLTIASVLVGGGITYGRLMAKLEAVEAQSKANSTAIREHGQRTMKALGEIKDKWDLLTETLNDFPLHRHNGGKTIYTHTKPSQMQFNGPPPGGQKEDDQR